jgi:hypothetical protein
MMNKLYPIALIALTILTLLSLSLNIVTIVAMLWARETALEEVAEARALLAGIKESTFSHTVTVQKDIPVETSVPFEHDIIVPINTTIPINTTVTVPIEAGILGTLEIDIPIRTFVPINLEIAVPVSQTVDVSTTVEVDLEVPIEIDFSETSMVEHLDERDAALERVEGKLKDPLASEEE